MAYNSQQNYRVPQRTGGYNQHGSHASPVKPKITAEPLPADYVDAAENVIRDIAESGNKYISTSKIRNLLSLISDIYNIENIRNEDTISEGSVTALSLFKIRAAYEAGREPEVKTFVEKAKILEYVKGIGTDRTKLLNFSHYMEALVAYHRYYSLGKDK